jgi:carboxy-terminal domain RNA polymerase II polypeptide A small phosphatase
MVNIILDLDETLIHTCEITDKYDKGLDKLTDFHFMIDGQYYWVIRRPGLELFLEFIFKYFNVGIWTAADKLYAKEICKKILSKRQLKMIKFIYSRQFCHLDTTFNPPIFTKPLVRIFDLYPGFKGSNTIIIDNTYNVMRYNQQNGIQIPDFVGDINDVSLYKIRNNLIKYYESIPLDTPIWGLVQRQNKILQL